MRNLTNDETEYTFGRNLSNDNGEILSFDLSANLPLVYTSNTDEASVIGLKGLNALGTANQILAMDSSGTNMIFKNDSDTNFWNLNSFSLTPKLDSYNVIIGDEVNANANNVELLVYGDMELKQTLYSTNNNQNKIDFDTTYGLDFYGFYYTPTSRSYNMSFRNNQHGSNFPYIGVTNTGDMIFHINGVGDAMIIKTDRDININVGDLIGDTTGNYTKNRMKDIYCRNIYSEPIEIKNSTTSSGYILLYENSSNGTGYVKLEAPASLGSDITATLPSTGGILALQSEIRTDAQIRGLFSGTPPISVSASGVISTTFTSSSTNNVSGKTFTDLTNFNASISVKGSSNFGTGTVRFYDLDNSHYTEIRPPNTLLANHGITLPDVTCVLSYNGQNVSLFNNDAGYITATSTETLENKTLKSPIFTSTSGAYEKMILKDENLTHNINIFTPNLTDNINVAFPSETGTLAITDNIPDLTTATNFGTSAPSTITIGSSSRQMELEATNFTFTDTNGTSILKITDSDVEINGADFGIKARTSSDPPRLYFWDSDRSHYIALQGQEIGSNVNLTLPHVTAELAYKGQNISDFTNNAGYITESNNYWELSSSTLTPKIDTYNVIIGQKANANSNNVELLVYGDGEIKDKLRSSSDTEIYLNFDTTYGVRCFGKYYAPTTTSYNMSFENTQTSSTYPFIGVDNTGNFVIHINGVADIMRVKTDKNVEIVDGDLIGTATGNFPKARMNDIYCRNLYSEPIVISNGSTSSAYILMYEDSDNGTNYTKLQALASIGSNNTLTLPENTGTIISSASNNLCSDATSTISIASSSNPRHLDIYTPEIEVSTLGDTNAFIEMRSGTGNASSSNVSTLKLYNKNNTKSAFLGLDTGDEAFFVNNASNNSGETKLSLNAYSTFANGYYTSTRSYPLTYRSSINSTYYAHFYTTNGGSNGFHISSVGDSWETLLSRDIKYYDTDFSGETNGVPSYAKLQMGDIYMEDLFAEALNYTSATQVSDARLKKNLKPIENAIDTLNKLTPLIYDKKVKEEDDLWGKEYEKESGLIAQNVYNEVPELKFIVNNVAEDISSNFDSSGNLVRDCCGWDIIEDQPRREYPIEVDSSGNPTENSGKLIHEATYKKVKNPNKKLSINYEDLIAFLIKGVQDLSKQVNQQQQIIDKLLSSNSFKEFKS